MDKPKEVGFIKIPCSLYDLVHSFRLSGELSLIFHYIIRKTFGFHKDRDHIANSQIAMATGLTKGNVSRGLSKLIKHKIVIKTDNFNNKGHALEINLNNKEWIQLVIKTDNKSKPNKKLSILKKELSKQITTVIKSDNKRLSKVRDTKESKRYSKDTIQKKGEIVGSKDPTPKQKALKFFNGVSEVVDVYNKVRDMNKIGNVEEAQVLKDSASSHWVTAFMTALHENHNNIGKVRLWNEIKDFCLYWTEKSSDGKRERWEMQKTYEIDRRLVTWLNKSFKGFSESYYQNNKPKGKEIII